MARRGFRGANVYINVYDLSQVNSYTYEFGVGVFHSGVEVMGTEYTFGGHENSSSGIFTHTPRQVAIKIEAKGFYDQKLHVRISAGSWCDLPNVC